MRLRLFSIEILVLGFALFAPVESVRAQQQVESFPFHKATTWAIGLGKADITGPVADLHLMGYAADFQIGQGLQSRLYARSFILQDRDGRQWIYVNCDLQSITQAVKVEVINRLQERWGTKYDHDNVLLGSTHNHNGPAGYSKYNMYVFSSWGFSKESFEVIVQGILLSIERSLNNMQEAYLFWGSGLNSTLDIALNRSKEAFLKNKDKDQVAHGKDVNEEMVLIKAVDLKGKPLAMLNWYGVHGTSARNNNLLVSSDNKGYAAHLTEKIMSERYGVNFLAGFANSESGDVSPNVHDMTDDPDFVRVAKSGHRQAQLAEMIFPATVNPLIPRARSRHIWVNMPGYQVNAEFTGNDPFSGKAFGPKKLCRAAQGYSMAAGAEDGPSPYRLEDPRASKQGISEGLSRNREFHNTLPIVLRILRTILHDKFGLGPEKEDELCHEAKPILIVSGRPEHPWSPQTLPFQLTVIDQLALIALPGEITTAAAYRLKQVVLRKLGPMGVKKAVIASPANTYSGYVTTYEEYQEQHYEGASTHFGPHTAAAYRQIFAQLADAIAENTTITEQAAIPEQVEPFDFRSIMPIDPTNLPRAKYDYDAFPAQSYFGKVLSKTRSSYKKGQTVKVTFQATHPNHRLLQQSPEDFSYLRVFRLNGGDKLIATDTDPDTQFVWRRSGECEGCSTATLYWKIPADALAGEYLITYQSFEQSGNPITGSTEPFNVEED